MSVKINSTRWQKSFGVSLNPSLYTYYPRKNKKTIAPEIDNNLKNECIFCTDVVSAVPNKLLARFMK